MKMKYFALLIWIFVACDDKTYFYSPDKQRCITFIEKKDDPYLFYVIPEKWMGSGYPNDNYLMISWSDVRDFEVNWGSPKLHIVYPYYLINKLDTCLVDFTNELYASETYIENGERWRKPPLVEGFLISDILTGKYKKKRTIINQK